MASAARRRPRKPTGESPKAVTTTTKADNSSGSPAVHSRQKLAVPVATTFALACFVFICVLVALTRMHTARNSATVDTGVEEEEAEAEIVVFNGHALVEHVEETVRFAAGRTHGGDADALAAVEHFHAAVITDPDAASSNAWVNLANALVRLTESCLFRESAIAQPNPREFDRPFFASYLLFLRAIQMSDHTGAHYSAGLMRKIYSSAQFVPPGDFTADRHLCASAQSYLRLLPLQRQPGFLNLPEQCPGGPTVSFVSDVPEGVTDVTPDGESPAAAATYAVRVRNTGEAVAYRERQQRVLKIEPRGGISVEGRDGLIHNMGDSAAGGGGCQVFLLSSRCYMPVFRQFRGPRESFRHFPEVASAVQFSGNQFYHWVFETLVRVAQLIDVLQSSPDTVLLIPAVSQQTAMFDMLRRVYELGGLQNQVVMFEPHMRITADVMYTADWGPAADGDSPSGFELLPPRKGLRQLRDMLRSSPPGAAADTTGNDVVLILREPGTARAFGNEGEVVAQLREALPAGVKLRLFRAEDEATDWSSLVATFQHARVVVGAHGGGLSNTILCAPGTALVEVALPEPEFQEYQHAAAALDLQYWRYGGIPDGQFEAQLWPEAQSLANLVLRAHEAAGAGEHVL